jgi:hypothetical protein
MAWFPSSVAVWPCCADKSADVAVQVVVPFHSSAELSVALPLEPPATSTCPFDTIADGSSVAEWAWRAAVIVPAEVQLPVPDEGLKRTVVASVVVPLLPPVTSRFPLASTVTVCPSRVLGSDVWELKAFCAGSKR